MSTIEIELLHKLLRLREEMNDLNEAVIFAQARVADVRRFLESTHGGGEEL